MKFQLPKYHVKDIIFVALIAIFCGAIFFATDLAYNFVSAALSAIGLGPVASDAMLGLWMIAGPLAAVLTQKAGASVLAETLGGFVEMMLGGQFGASAILAGFIQGVGSEVGFAITGYKHFDRFGLLMSTVTSTIVTFIWAIFSSGYLHYKLSFLLVLIGVRFISIGLFSGVLVQGIHRLVQRAGMAVHAG